MDLEARVIRAVAELVGGPVRVVDTLVDHDERCVLDVVLADGTAAIVKGDLDVERSEREARVLAAAGAHGVPVPAVLAGAASSPAVLVLAPVDGGWLAPDRPDRAWRAAGAALRALHRTPIAGLPGLAGQRDWASGVRRMLTYFELTAVAAGLSADTIAAVRPVVEALADDCPAKLRDATLHGDCVPIHVRLDERDEVMGLLDLGDACRGDPAWDIAVLTLRSPERLPAVLDGYGADDRLRAWVDRVLPAYRALRSIAEVGWLADHGFDPTEAVEQAERWGRRAL
ncbi:MAG TPA: aminoglycoside phosphotransferase family protein [Acidimicrobiales bacterium]|jgi:aminoglycoside phosphotransferase (APT) family kinase protein|nr:aminoglycoside phosphotransferase family protein [Acidimicrobiales bacterium]